MASPILCRRAKFDRSRLLPLHPTATEALRRYASERDRLCPRARSRAFFVSSAGTALDRSGVGKTFRKITIAIGSRTATVHPRLHDLRHSFAVHTLIRWQRSGVNVNKPSRQPGRPAVPQPAWRAAQHRRGGMARRKVRHRSRPALPVPTRQECHPARIAAYECNAPAGSRSGHLGDCSLAGASIKTTMDLYGHLYEGVDEAAAQALDALHRRALETPKFGTCAAADGFLTGLLTDSLGGFRGRRS